MKPIDVQKGIPSDDELRLRIQNYVDRADALYPRLDQREPEALIETRALRHELDAENHEYTKVGIRKLIPMGSFMAKYARWVQDADVHTAGQLDYRKAKSFVYDVSDYVFYDMKLH